MRRCLEAGFIKRSVVCLSVRPSVCLSHRVMATASDDAAAVCIGDDELVSSLLFDAEATRGVVSDWRKENSDAILNRSSRKKYAHWPHLLEYDK